MPVRYILSSVWVRLSIFSQLSIIQYMGLCGFSLPISLVMIERIYTLSYYHHQIWSMSYYPLFRVRSWNNGIRCMSLYSYEMQSMKLKGGIRVSPCPSVCLSVCPSVDRIVSTLYLLQYSLDPFHIYTSYQATSDGVSYVKFFENWKMWSFGKFFNFVTLTLSGFDMGSNMSWSIVWVIMGHF